MRKSVIPESDDMNLATPVNDPLRFSFHEIILQQGELISDKLNMLRFEHYPPKGPQVLLTIRGGLLSRRHALQHQKAPP